MARSRNLKPAFFLNYDLSKCPYPARILFAGLWCLADREGRLEDIPEKIKAQVLPYDSEDSNKLLEMLSKKGFIIRYQKRSEKYIQIVNFSKHQSPHIKEPESLIPAPDKHQTRTRQEPDKSDSKTPDSLNPLPDSLNPQPSIPPNPLLGGIDFLAEFEKIWKDYPKPIGKKQALRHFAASVRTLEDVQGIRRALENYLKTREVKGGFVKHGSTWFNNWRDFENYTDNGTNHSGDVAVVKLVNAWKKLLEIPKEQYEVWDRANFKSCASQAVYLCEVFKVDLKEEKKEALLSIAECMMETYNELKEKNLNCTMETVAKRAIEWRQKRDTNS